MANHSQPHADKTTPAEGGWLSEREAAELTEHIAKLTQSGVPLDQGLAVTGSVDQSGRIQAVGTELSIPDGARVIALPGVSVTPGLIDANAKLSPPDPQSRR